LKKGIGTPKPIAFKENYSLIGLQDSYYVCEHINCDLTYKELVQTDYPDGENILRQFIHFTYQMHKNGIEFKVFNPQHKDFHRNIWRFAAPHALNTLIAEHSDVIIAFWDRQSTGTKDTIDKAIAQSKKSVYI
jgi:hypothetical protein